MHIIICAFFQTLDKAIHSILTDDDKRRVYDETGDVDGSGGHDMSEESFEFWDNYFRSMFPKVTVDDIESFAMLYKGSRGEVSSDHNERQDILDAYQQHGGRFDHIMECVMLAEEEDEPRITEIILAAIGSGDLAATPAFDKHVAAVSSKKTKKSRKREPSSSHSTEQGGIEERAGLSSRGSGKKKSKDKSDMGDLAAMILGNRNNQRGAMSSILARYGGGDGPADLGDYDISDEAFERTRASLLSSQQKTGKSSSKSTAGEKKKKQKQK